jgi:hypothetical protein
MRGYYMFTTIEGVTVLRWYRTYDEVARAHSKWAADYGIDATVRGEAAASNAQ